MAVSKTADRFWVLFLFLSFLLFNITYLPNLLNTDKTSNSDNTDDGPSVSLIISGNLDCLDAENVSFRISSDQTFVSRKLTSERCTAILGALPLIFFVYSGTGFISDDGSGQGSAFKITEFLRATDGMV